MNRIRALAAIALLTWSGGRAVAQEPPPTEPAPAWPLIGVTGFAPALRPGGTSLTDREEPGLLRRAIPDGDIRDWIAADDPVVGMLEAPDAGPSQTALLFEVGADGRVTDCRVEPHAGADTRSEGLCERMSGRMRLTPALNLAGERTADRYFVHIWFRKVAQRPERVVEHQMLPPSPPPPPPPGGWPLPWATPGIAVTGLDLLPGGGSAPGAAGEPWAGVMMTLGADGRVSCRVAASSGDPGLDRDACRAANRARYGFAEGGQGNRVQIHFVREGRNLRALLAEHLRPAPARATPEGAAAIRAALPSAGDPAALRLRMEIDAGGRATQCLVTTSSGDDATDIAACGLATEGARFHPPEDVFGRPRAGSLYGWSPVAGEVRP